MKRRLLNILTLTAVCIGIPSANGSLLDLSTHLLSDPESIKSSAKFELDKQKQIHFDNETYDEVFQDHQRHYPGNKECFGEVYQPAKYIEKVIEVETQPEFTTKMSTPPKFATSKKKVLIKPGHFIYKKISNEKFHSETRKYLTRPEEKKLGPNGDVIQVSAPKYVKVTRKTISEHPTYKKEWVPPKFQFIEVESRVSTTKIVTEKRKRETSQFKYLEKIADGKKVTKRIICEKSISPAIVEKVQDILMQEGLIAKKTGSYDSQTKKGVQSYQSKYRLSQGKLDIQTLGAMGLIAH